MMKRGESDFAAAILGRRGWLSRQVPEFQAEVLRRSVERTFEAGSLLYQVGDPPGGVYGLVDGLVKLEIAAPGGTYRVATIGQPGFWVGHYATIRSGPRIAALRVAVRSVFRYLPRSEVEGLMEEAVYCRAFGALVAEELEEAIFVLGYAMSGKPEIRVAACLGALAQSYGDGRQAELRVTQSDLAEMCALARQTVQQVLVRLEALGLAVARYGRVQVPDIAALVAFAEQGVTEEAV
jgi:CRP-like cAMP-binding protein